MENIKIYIKLSFFTFYGKCKYFQNSIYLNKVYVEITNKLNYEVKIL